MDQLTSDIPARLVTGRQCLSADFVHLYQPILFFPSFLVAVVNRVGLLRIALTGQLSLLALFGVRSYYQMEEKQDQAI
jgi:hypothetical protein